MQVRILRSFGNHEPGDIVDSCRKLENGRTVDSEMDRKAFDHWIEVGWAERITEAPKKRVGRPPKNKAITA